MIKISGTIGGEFFEIEVEGVRRNIVEKRKTVLLRGLDGRIGYIKKFKKQSIIPVKIIVPDANRAEFEKIFEADSTNCQSGLKFKFDNYDFLPEKTMYGYIKLNSREYEVSNVWVYDVEVIEK